MVDNNAILSYESRKPTTVEYTELEPQASEGLYRRGILEQTPMVPSRCQLKDLAAAANATLDTESGSPSLKASSMQQIPQDIKLSALLIITFR